MNFKAILNNMIEEEFSKIEKEGKRVKLKTVTRKRVKYTLFSGLLFLMFLIVKAELFAFIDLIVYFILMYNANNLSVIAALSKKSPNTPVSDIIKGDMK